MVKIKIKPKIIGALETTRERQRDTRERQRDTRERQEECCDEIQSLRCELEIMKTTMYEMRRDMNEMQLQLQSGGRNSCHDNRSNRNLDHNYNCEKTAGDFGEWVSGLGVTRQDLEAMFESKDMVDWASKFIVADLKQRSSHPYPLCAIKGSRNEMLMYDKDAWKKLADQVFLSKIVNTVFKKLLAAFTAWKNENYNKILTSEHFSTLYHSNYARILSFNENASKLKIKLFNVL
jgi:hypothetical protein